MTKACRQVGVKLSDEDSYTGLQDAVTPGYHVYVSVIIWIILAGVFVYAFISEGIISALIAVAIFLASSLIAGMVFIPKANAGHYKKLIYGSMNRRYKNFIEKGDKARAVAIKVLIDRFDKRIGAPIDTDNDK
jgi:hypothetical protein